MRLSRLSYQVRLAIFASFSGVSLHVVAQDSAQARALDSEKTLEEVVVKGEVIYRDRTEATAPTLSYDLEYFQRFEPLTVGDMLKRVPSVTFVSDVLEYDGVRLRGLDSVYTQILINGKRVPGAGFDRSFFVDRIPAELVERIEIIRSASSDRSGDAVSGALNIVLRDGYSLDGGYVRMGAQRFSDSEIEPTLGFVWGGEALGGNLLVGANTQGRRNPKAKLSERFASPTGALVNIEDQVDVRSGNDYAFNADYKREMGEGMFNLAGFFVRTDRLEDERSIEYRTRARDNANLLTINDNEVDIQTDNYTLSTGINYPMWDGESEFRIDYAGIKDVQDEFEDETEYLRDTNPFPESDRFTRDLILLDIRDRDLTGEFQHKRNVGDAELKFGVQLTEKDRESNVRESRFRVTIPNTGTPPAIPGVRVPPVAVLGGFNQIAETRIEPFVKYNAQVGQLDWEAGLRYERTDVEIEDFTVPAANRTSENDYGFLLPSVHLRYNIDDATRLNLSAARTVRRPSFNQISPALLTGALGDNDVLGNPNLKPEDAFGLDAGFERRLGKRGVVGVNLFYRDIGNLIEIANTGVVGSDGVGSFVLQPRNGQDGQVWGAELDLSTPLSSIGMDNTGVFVNYSWLDSEVNDVFGKRRFNNQSNFVYNVGFIQELPVSAASFGITFRKQGDALSRIISEEVKTTYDGDLEAFIEKRFGDNWTARLTGTNLLDQSKDEFFNKFNTIQDQISRSFREYELESETSGRAVQLMVRYDFDNK